MHLRDAPLEANSSHLASQLIYGSDLTIQPSHDKIILVVWQIIVTRTTTSLTFYIGLIFRNGMLMTNEQFL